MKLLRSGEVDEAFILPGVGCNMLQLCVLKLRARPEAAESLKAFTLQLCCRVSPPCTFPVLTRTILDAAGRSLGVSS